MFQRKTYESKVKSLINVRMNVFVDGISRTLFLYRPSNERKFQDRQRISYLIVVNLKNPSNKP